MKFITANLKHCTISLQLWRHSLGIFFFLTWKFNQTTPWSWICLARWWGVVFTPAGTCTPDSIQLQISVTSTHLQMALNGQLCLLSIITVTYPVLQISEQLLKLLYSKMVQRYMKTEILLRWVNRERLVSSLIFICFFNQLIMAVNGCFSEKIWLSSLSTTNGHSP